MDEIVKQGGFERGKRGGVCGAAKGGLENAKSLDDENGAGTETRPYRGIHILGGG
jgi:hypothetical protein